MGNYSTFSLFRNRVLRWFLNESSGEAERVKPPFLYAKQWLHRQKGSGKEPENGVFRSWRKYAHD